MERFMNFNQGKDDTIEPAYIKNFSGSNNGQSELPAVTIEDNNKVLTVVNGEWDKADLPGGGSTDFVITVTRVSNAWSIDKTVDEVLATYDAGNNNITIIVNYNNDVYVLRNFQESRQIYSYDNELQLAAILPDMSDAADTVNKFSISTFVFSASDTYENGKRVSACIYKSAYTISDSGTVTGTKTEVR